MDPTRPCHRRTAVAMVIAALLAALLPFAAPSPAGALGAPVVERLGGANRIETAVAVSADSFASAGTVVIATGSSYADALAGATLAAERSAPMLLVGDTLDPAVAAEIDRLGPTRAVVLGGPAAVSAGVTESLTALGLAVTRIQGADRFATARAVAAEVGPADVAFVVQGISADPARGWPDAVAVAPLAAHLGAPIIPVFATELPADSAAALAASGASEVWIVGGTASVSPAVQTAVAEAVPGATVRRVAGRTRFETSAALFDFAVSEGMSPARTWLATGRNFADALAAGPAVAAAGETLLLVDPTELTASPATRDRLVDPDRTQSQVVVLGGGAAISPDIPVQIGAARAAVTGAFCLTVLHNNDGESQIFNAGGLIEWGGIARFATLARQEQMAAMGTMPAECGSRGVITVTSGDNFLAGPEWNASLDKGVPFYDSIALDYIGYDALALGNHDFDFGPDVTADFISGFTSGSVFLSANLDVSNEPRLRALRDAGRLAPSTVIDTGGRRIGVIGLTTPALRSISSPRDVVVGQDVAGAVQTQVSALQGQGVDIIVVISHLQGIAEDVALIGQLSGVDVVVAGGGDEVLGSPGSLFVPGDDEVVAGTYPFYVTSGDGDPVPVVTTAGDYKYVGRLVNRFDTAGNLVSTDAARSELLAVTSARHVDDPFVQANVVDPIAAFVADLAATQVGTSEVALEGRRPAIRNAPTNLGALMADALLWTGQQEAAEYGISPPQVAIQNGGGIRNNSLIPAGNLTVLTTFDVAPFSNFVSVHPSITPAQLKALLENGYSGVETAAGQFAHVAGMRVTVDVRRPVGDRVRSITLTAGTPIVANGAVVAGAPNVGVATIDFLSRGGDNYPFPDDSFVSVGVSYQQALRDYIEDGLDGVVTAARYPAAGVDRITIIQ